jgi:hypothetical protein
MALVIELAPEVELRLRAEAARNGLDTEDFARRLIENRYQSAEERTWAELTMEERRARIRAAQQRYTSLDLDSEEILRDRQAEKARET